MRPSAYITGALLLLLLAGCGTSPPAAQSLPATLPEHWFAEEDQRSANEIILQAMGLLDTGYLFGGINPEAGLDCSGMVVLVVERATGRKLPHNAAKIAAQTRAITREALQPADLVFFNTGSGTFSHVGIYIGNGRFIHAPSSRGRVRVDHLDTGYFRQRFSAARSLFP